MTTGFNPHCTNISRIKISFPIAPLPTCPPDKPRVYCFVDPCQVTTCPTHPEARCISDYCGGCNARFFDDEGNEVTKSCSKCGYSIIKTGHIKFAVTDQQFFFCLLWLCSIRNPSLPPVFDEYLQYMPAN